MVEEQQRKIEIQRRIKNRELFLKRIYDESKGSTSIPVSLKKISEEMALSLDQVVDYFRYYKDKGLLKSWGNEKTVLTQMGIDFFENQKVVISPDFSVQTMPGHRYCIFISHIHENESVAQKLKEFFKAQFGNEVDVFVSGDPQNIPAGQNWFATIIEGIRNCNTMIILCSPQSVERKWIYFDAGAAAILGRKIIPLCFGGLNPGMLPSPLDQIQKQAIDGHDAGKLQQYFEILIKEIAGQTNENRPILNVLKSEFNQELRQSYLRNQEQLLKNRGRVIYKIEDDTQI
jgi:hypothetical protein